MGLQWIKYGMDVASTQWSMHMDLLDLWRNELSAISLSAYVARAGNDLSKLQNICNYYEQVLRLFAFDTGFEPLVAIFDGNIRQNQDLYAFFSRDPVYQRVSGAYYSAKLEDVNTQFTTQFVGNFGMIWGLFIPDMVINALVAAPIKLFTSRANKILTQRKNNLVEAGDFIKWASHCYSAAFKNYSPFVCSAEMWRVYNPLIDLYWSTIISHILLLKSLRSALPDFYVKPFIETQRTNIYFDGADTAVSRLVGNGVIEATIPSALVTPGAHVATFDTYGLKLDVDLFNIWSRGYYKKSDGSSDTWPERAPHFINRDVFEPWHGYYTPDRYSTGIIIGFVFAMPEPIKTVMTIECSVSGIAANQTGFAYGCILSCNTIDVVQIKDWENPGTFTAHFPAIKYPALYVQPKFQGGIGVPREITVRMVSIEPDPDYPGPYYPTWGTRGLNNYCPKEVPF